MVEPVAEGPLVPGNLPLQLTSFVGRETAIAEVKRLLSTTRLLTLTGAGGCGKSRLALRIGEDVLHVYADGAWLVELAALSDPTLIPHTVATALGVREAAGRPPLDLLTVSLRGRSLLLILDNCEGGLCRAGRDAPAPLPGPDDPRHEPARPGRTGRDGMARALARRSRPPIVPST